jgi:multimeric flavodoxin WrbA
MNILGIYGSPRKGGNTDQLLDKALEGATRDDVEISKIYARNLDIKGCLGCGGCEKTGKCVIKDEMQSIYPLLERAVVIFLASPIYFYGVTGQVKLLIDRSQAMWSKRLLEKNYAERKKYDSGKGYMIAAGASRGENLFEGAQLTAKYFYDALDMSYEGGIFFRRLDEKTAVKNNPETLQEAYNLGKKSVSLL